MAAPAQQVEDESIAVLPFVNMSSDPEQEYFSDGISEELLNLLAKIPELRVAARTSAFSYKGKDTKIDVIGRELGVAHVLEGSVRKAGSKVRITAQLIRAETGYHLWSETWDRSLEDIFDVQDEIAAVVVEELKITLLKPVPVVQETNPETYALYLRARHLTRQATPQSYERALDLLEKALAIASDYAPAWRQRGVIYMTQADRGLRPAAEGFELGREATEMALSIDPGNALAHASLCRIAMSEDHDLAAAAGHMQTALSLNPTDSTILSGAATMAETLGRVDNAIALQEFIARRDPVATYRSCQPGRQLHRCRTARDGHRLLPHRAAPVPRQHRLARQSWPCLPRQRRNRSRPGGNRQGKLRALPPDCRGDGIP